MIQTHRQLITISREYNTLFSKNEFYPVQKAYTTPHFLVLGLRFPGRNVALYIGRGNQYEGLFLSDKFPPSFLRVQDRFLDYMRKYLVGTRLGKMEVDEHHFLVLFHFKNEHVDNSFSIGYKNRQLFFIKETKGEVYTSWNGETSTGKNIVELVDDFLGPRSPLPDQEGPHWNLEKYLEDETKKVSGKPLQKKKEKFLERKIKNINADLEGVMKWPVMEEDVLAEKVNLEADSVELHGHRIKFLPQSDKWKKRNLIFEKIKKLKRAEKILKGRSDEAAFELAQVKRGEFDFEVTKEKAIAPLWSSGQKTVSKKEHNVKSFTIKSIHGLLGLDAKSNDWLRSEGAKEHYWFHIENYPGAHCLLKTDDLSPLAKEDLSAIASLLCDSSQLSIREIPLIYSQLKNVKGLKGAPGKVLIKKPKYLRCEYVDWKERITTL